MAKLSWAAGFLGLAVIVGCENKPVEKIPSTPPLAPTEAHLVLKNLQYIAVRKDNKHISLVAPVTPDVVFGSGWWFHQHAGKMGIALDEKEIVEFGLVDLLNKGYISTQPLKMMPNDPKLDNFPPPDPKAPNYDPTYDITQARKVYNAGLYRLMKGVPSDMWADMVVMETKSDPANTKLRQLVFGYAGTPVMNVAALQKDDGKWVVTYIQFKAWPEQLAKMVKKAQN
jgi:hypothetical protein